MCECWEQTHTHIHTPTRHTQRVITHTHTTQTHKSLEYERTYNSLKMASAIKGKARLVLAAAAAKPSPKIGQALGPLGVNMVEFCKQFNARTENYVSGIPLPVRLTAFGDRSFKFEVTAPTTSWFLKKAAGIEKASAKPGKIVAGKVSIRHVYHITQIKGMDESLKNLPKKDVCRSIIGQARSMGIEVTPR